MRLFGGTATPRRARISRPALTASATEVTPANAERQRRLDQNQEWHGRALAYYNTLGECYYPAQFYSRALSKIRFFPAVLDEKGDPQEAETGPLVDLWKRVQDPGGGGTSELQSSYGRLMWLIGDGYLTVTGNDEGEAWEYLSPLEFKVLPDNGGYQRRRAPGLEPELLMDAPSGTETIGAGEARVYRLWRRHPTYSEWSDSPVRAVLDLYQLLTMLTLAADAQGKSRAANRGLVYMPEELDFGPQDSLAGDEDPDEDPFLQEFTEGLTTAIRDPGSAAAMAPMVARGPAILNTPNGVLPMKDAMGWIPLGPEDKYAEAEMWDKTIRRIAVGLDWPAELMTGLGELNHWSGWLVDEQAFRQHIAPTAQRFCDDIASAYLRPAARAQNFPEWESVVMAYDPAAAIVHPDETKTWQEAHDRIVVSDASYRDKIGATDRDAPDDDEWERRVAILLKKLPEGVDVEEEPAPAATPVSGGTGGDVIEEAPEQNNGNGNGERARAASALEVARIVGAAELCVERARALAGARLVTKSKGCEDCRRTIADIPQSLVAAALGAETVRDIINGHVTEASLTAGAGEELAATVGRWGVTGDWPKELGSLVEQHALRTLYEREPPPLPSGFAAVVAKALR